MRRETCHHSNQSPPPPTAPVIKWIDNGDPPSFSPHTFHHYKPSSKTAPPPPICCNKTILSPLHWRFQKFFDRLRVRSCIVAIFVLEGRQIVEKVDQGNFGTSSISRQKSNHILCTPKARHLRQKMKDLSSLITYINSIRLDINFCTCAVIECIMDNSWQPKLPSPKPCYCIT